MDYKILLTIAMEHVKHFLHQLGGSGRERDEVRGCIVTSIRVMHRQHKNARFDKSENQFAAHSTERDVRPQHSKWLQWQKRNPMRSNQCTDKKDQNLKGFFYLRWLFVGSMYTPSNYVEEKWPD